MYTAICLILIHSFLRFDFHDISFRNVIIDNINLYCYHTTIIIIIIIIIINALLLKVTMSPTNMIFKGPSIKVSINGSTYNLYATARQVHLL